MSEKIGERQVLFKAQGFFGGTYQEGTPRPNSPYPTASSFYSNAILGQQIWPSGTSLDYLEHRLSTSLNDRHNRIGIIGDWKDTHDPAYGGVWTYLYQEFTPVTTYETVNGKRKQDTRYIIHYEESRTSDDY